MTAEDWQRVITVFRNDLSGDLNDNGLDSVHDNQRSPARYAKNRWHEKELFYGTTTGTITILLITTRDSDEIDNWFFFKPIESADTSKYEYAQPNNLKNSRAEINAMIATQDLYSNIMKKSLKLNFVVHCFLHSEAVYASENKILYIFVENEPSNAFHLQASLVLWSQACEDMLPSYYVRICNLAIMWGSPLSSTTEDHK